MVTARQVSAADHTATAPPADDSIRDNPNVRPWSPVTAADHAHAAAEHVEAALALADWADRHRIGVAEVAELWDALAWHPIAAGRCSWCRRRRPLRADRSLLLHTHPDGTGHCPGSRKGAVDE